MHTYTGVICISMVFFDVAAHLFQEPVRAREGTEFIIKLSSSPSTGPDWTYANAKELKEYVELIGDSFKKDEDRVPGREGIKQFKYKALRPGRCVMRFNKKREWGNSRIAESIQINLHIKKGP